MVHYINGDPLSMDPEQFCREENHCLVTTVIGGLFGKESEVAHDAVV